MAWGGTGGGVVAGQGEMLGSRTKLWETQKLKSSKAGGKMR